MSVVNQGVIEKQSNLVAKSLIELMMMRGLILDELSKLDMTKESDIEVTKNLLLKKGAEGADFSPISVEENFLWILDDKFMTYNYVAGEKRINTLLKAVGLEGNDSRDRFDIAIYSNSQDVKRAIVIEFKKFSANYKENGTGIFQLRTYAKQLQNSGIDELYLYLIASIDEELRENLTDALKFKRVFSQRGEIYQGSFENINAYIQVISPKALIADARARNKTFIDMIKEQYGVN